MAHYHDGISDFPHGAGASEPGWYWYPDAIIAREPLGPFVTQTGAKSAGYHYSELCKTSSH